MKIDQSKTLSVLPREWPDDLLPQIQKQVAESKVKVVVLDDDPTGTQTVHHVQVLTSWQVDDLVNELNDPNPVLYILTNSRSMLLAVADEINQEIAQNIKLASQQASRPFVLVSRSDSTLRGHFPGEVLALAQGLEQPPDGILIVPFFLEGGRYTIQDIHYVAEGNTLVPAAETEYARDASFGYRNSNLKAWVSEKYQGEVTPDEVASISIDDLRAGGPEVVQAILTDLHNARVCIVNAASYRDIEVFVLALLGAEAQGKRYLYRTAASFVRVRGGIQSQPLLRAQDLAPHVGEGPGLIIAGSHIHKSTSQIESVRQLEGVESVEVQVPELLAEGSRQLEIARTAAAINYRLAEGKDTLVFTSRKLMTGETKEGSLLIGKIVSDALVEIVRRVREKPGWVIAKGGITSSDIATRALDIRRVLVLGQAIPGVPVWQSGPESRWPGLVYVVFPGNVGSPNAIAEMVEILRNRSTRNKAPRH